MMDITARYLILSSVLQFCQVNMMGAFSIPRKSYKQMFVFLNVCTAVLMIIYSMLVVKIGVDAVNPYRILTSVFSLAFVGIAGKYRGLKLLFVFLFCDNVVSATENIGFILVDTLLNSSMPYFHELTALLRSTLMITVTAIVILAMRKFFLKLLDMKNARFGLLSLSVVIVEGLVIFASVYPASIDQRPEDYPMMLATLFVLVFILCFCVRIIISMKQNLAEEQAIEIEKLQFEQMSQQLDISKKYYDEVLSSINQTRAYRHDMNAHIRMLSAMLNDGKVEDAKQYLRDMSKSMPVKTPKRYCDSYEVNALLSYFEEEFEKSGIDFQTDIKISESAHLNPMYWCIILENTLRNAIDACEKVKTAKFCTLKINTIGTKIAVNIKNTFNGVTNMEKETYLTTKTDSEHGYGILNVKKVVESFHGWLKIETYKEGSAHIFSISIVLETHD